MKKKISVAIIAICILMAIIFVGILQLQSRMFSASEKREFSIEEWQTDIYNRGTMIESLLEQYNFVGMSKDDVITILGEEGLYIGKNSLRYETGGGYFHDEILSFSIDEKGQIISYGITN